MQKSIFLTGLIAFSIFMYPVMAPAKTYDQCNFAAKCGLATSSAILTLPYFTGKMVYAFGGIVTAGAINFFSFRHAEATAEKIAFQSAGGDWYITPGHLLGVKKLQFVGPVE